MTKKLTPAECPRKDVIIPRTRGQSDEAKKQGSMLGYLKRKAGRPPKSTSTLSSSSPSTSLSSLSISSASASSLSTKRDDPPFGSIMGGIRKKAKKQEYVKWEDYPDILQQHVNARMNNKKLPLTGHALPPPRTTINDYVKRLIDHEKATGEKLTVSEWIDQYKKNQGRNSLLSSKVRGRIQNIIVARDGRNSPLGRKDILEIIESVAGCTPKQADNYYCYAVKNNKFPKLKKGGKVSSAQKTTTSWTQVTIQQQHWWHSTIDQVWEQQVETNIPAVDFQPV